MKMEYSDRRAYVTFTQMYNRLKREIGPEDVAYDSFKNISSLDLKWRRSVKLYRKDGKTKEACTTLLDILINKKGEHVFQKFVEVLKASST